MPEIDTLGEENVFRIAEREYRLVRLPHCRNDVCSLFG